MMPTIVSRDDVDGAAQGNHFTVTVDCDNGNEYDGNLSLRISAIFVILLGSLIGSLLPVFLARTSKLHVPQMTFFFAKYFGTGVIVATSVMHLLVPAFEALSSPCLEGLAISEYSWAGGICLITIMFMFALEVVVSHFDIFGDHVHETAGTHPSNDVLKKSSVGSTNTSPHGNSTPEHDPQSMLEANVQGNGNRSASVSGLPMDLSYPPGGENHLGHRKEHAEANFAAQMTAIFILEFGVIFHSIFIGLTLAVAGDEFKILYVVLVFHQTFEGLGLGSRLATASWPKRKLYMPYVLGFLYSISTPVAIAIGLGVRQTLSPSGQNTLIVNGIFDSISAGILLYTGLVELLAHEFMFNPTMQTASLKMKMTALGYITLGAGLMALLAEWA